MPSQDDEHMNTYMQGLYNGYVPLQPAYPQHIPHVPYPTYHHAHLEGHIHQPGTVILPYPPQHPHLVPTPILRSTYDDQPSTIPSSNLAPEPEQPTAPSSSTSLDFRPFTCLEANCPSTNRSFRRKGDLERHTNTVHRRSALQMWDCWLPGCGRKESEPRGGFSRKDHLIEHIRYVHHIDIPKNRRSAWKTNERDPRVHDCPVPDCDKRSDGEDAVGFQSQDKVFKHMADVHAFPAWMFPAQKAARAKSASRTPEVGAVTSAEVRQGEFSR